MQQIKHSNNLHSTWIEKPSAPENALEKMFRNSQKAIVEHQQKERNYPLNPRIVIPVTKPDSCPLPTPLRYITTHSEIPGPRAMEDAHFVKELPHGYLAGVFDGHGGAEASTMASQRFSILFEEHLSTSSQNVYYAFKKTLEGLHQEIVDSCKSGTTAVVCYIENKTNRIYTATLGDSEAHIYRMFHNRMQAIPASCVRNWTSKRDAERLAEAKTPVEEEFKVLNGSRALGDPEFPVIQKPKITVHQLLPGDIVNLASAGLKKFVNEKITAQKVHMITLDPEFTMQYSRLLVEDAIHYRSNDNVTAVTIQITEHSQHAMQ